MNKELAMTQWKLLATNQHLTAGHFIDRAILMAMGAKNKKNVPLEDIIASILQKSFSPNYKNSDQYPVISKYKKYWANVSTFGKPQILGLPWDKLLTESEFKQFKALASSIRTDKLGRKYIYYFTIQDHLTPEQQGVQAGHALFALGTYLGREDRNFNPKNVYFQWIGVKDESNLKAIAAKHANHRYVAFYEPDVGNMLTSIAFYPILWNKREDFLDYPLLTH